MDNIFYILLTIGIATVGGMVGAKLRLPAGAMMGAMLFVVGFNLLFGHMVFVSNVRVGIQLLSGAMAGSRMDLDEVRGMKKLFVPILLLVAGMFAVNVTLGLLIYWLSPLDAATALFAVAPGGASDMAVIGADLGANPSYIAILQLFRVVVIFIFIPPILKKHLGMPPSAALAGAKANRASPKGADGRGKARKPFLSRESLAGLLREKRPLAALLLCSTAVGLLFYSLGITAGAMIGGMLGGTAFCCIRGKVPFPSKLRFLMQIGSGAYIGVRFTRESLRTMGDLLIPLAIAFVGIFVYSFAIAFLIHRLTRLNLATCMLASSPGGRQEMMLMSEDMGADTPSVAIMQTARFFCVIALFPAMIGLITGLLP